MFFFVVQKEGRIKIHPLEKKTEKKTEVLLDFLFCLIVFINERETIDSESVHSLCYNHTAYCAECVWIQGKPIRGAQSL